MFRLPKRAIRVCLSLFIMRSNRKILFGLALIVGAALFYRAFLALSHLGASKSVPVAQNGAPVAVQTVSAPAPSGRIAYAAVDIPANSIVTPDMLVLKPNTGPSSKGFLTDIEAQGNGFITRRDIPAGSQIRPDADFIGHVSQTGIAGLLAPGERAMIVPIANKPTLHDLVRIGNYVDVFAAFDGQESRTLVENVRVLGVDVSANDYPNVNAAMRGPYKAAPQSRPAASEATAPSVGVAAPANGNSGAAPGGVTPTPTPAPANAPHPDPALILEVSPRQAAAIQLALASNATMDFLVRPALPSNRSNEPAPVNTIGGATIITTGTGMGLGTNSQAVSVTKPQIAPYAESRKNGPKAGGGKGSGGGGSSQSPRLTRGGRRPLEAITPDFPLPSSGSNVSTPPAGVPFPPVGGSSAAPSQSAPAPQQSYTIPVYGDGKILRQETVPLPSE